MVTPVVSSTSWIIVVPGFVVDRNAHFLGIPIVKAIATSVVFVTPKVLWVIDIGIVIDPFPVANIILRAPNAAISSLLNFLRVVFLGAGLGGALDLCFSNTGVSGSGSGSATVCLRVFSSHIGRQ